MAIPNPESQVPRSIRLKEEAAELLALILEDQVKGTVLTLVSQYLGHKEAFTGWEEPPENGYLHAADIARTLWFIDGEIYDPEKEIYRPRYVGPIPNVYEQITGKDISINSTMPEYTMWQILLQMLHDHGGKLPPGEAARRQSIMMQEPVIWTEEMDQRLRQICSESIRRTWAEIADMLGVNRYAAEEYARKNEIRKLANQMDKEIEYEIEGMQLLVDRHTLFEYLFDSGMPLKDIAIELGIKSKRPVGYLSEYAIKQGWTRERLPRRR